MNRRRKGFAMITALVLVSLTAMTITVMGVTVISQARRSRMLSEEGQLRSLLIAGARIAENQVQSNSSGHFAVGLPDSLRADGAGLAVDIRTDSSGNRVAEIEASLPHHRASQQVSFESGNGSWKTAAANLNP